jgi:hypothetical protein
VFATGRMRETSWMPAWGNNATVMINGLSGSEALGGGGQDHRARAVDVSVCVARRLSTIVSLRRQPKPHVAVAGDGVDHLRRCVALERGAFGDPSEQIDQAAGVSSREITLARRSLSCRWRPGFLGGAFGPTTPRGGRSAPGVPAGLSHDSSFKARRGRTEGMPGDIQCPHHQRIT